MFAVAAFFIFKVFLTSALNGIPPPDTCGPTLEQKPWYKLGFLQVSLILSQPFAQKLYQSSEFFAKHERSNCFGLSMKLSGRHKTALRWLLIVSGNVELNPGPVVPIDFESLSAGILKNVLQIVKGDDQGFLMPKAKDEMIAILADENRTFVTLAIQKSLGLVDQNPNPTRSPDTSPKLVKLSPFYTQDTKKWFELADQFFANCNDEQVKKNSVLRVIPMDVQTDCGLDVHASYETIKNQIIAHCDDSQDQKLRKLLGEQKLGDQKPSSALRKLQSLGQGNEKLVRLRFSEILPAEVRVVLATLDDTPIEKLAEAADKMIEQLPKTGVNAIGACADPQSPMTTSDDRYKNEISELKNEVAELTKAVHAIFADKSAQYGQSQQRGRPQFRNSTPGYGPQFTGNRNEQRERTESRKRSYRQGGALCYSHHVFGRRAFKCEQPCAWKEFGRPASPPNYSQQGSYASAAASGRQQYQGNSYAPR